MYQSVAPAQPAAQRPHILLAEDNPATQQVVRLQLQSMGVDADIVDNGEAALAAHRAAPGRYAAVLMDCLMPIMDGYQATRELRAEEDPEQHLLIIAMTANAQAPIGSCVWPSAWTITSASPSVARTWQPC